METNEERSGKIENLFITLDEAQELFCQAIELVESVIGSNPYIKSYWIDQAKILASSDHGFLSGSLNLDSIKGMVEEDPDKYVK